MQAIVARSNDVVTRTRASGAGTLRAGAVALLVAAATAMPAAADDLDVYRERLALQQKPNILFVLDYSGSMRRDTDGNHPPAAGREAKIDILRTAMENVLGANEQTINAGIGSVFGGRPSGVRWPIAPLSADPSTVDPDIPERTRSMAQVMMSQLERQGAAGNTQTVNALIEAAQYFGGTAVLNGSHPVDEHDGHRPDTWDPATRRYTGGNPRAAVPAAYSTAGGRGYRGKKWRGASYEAPPIGECQANAIVLISDGQPTRLQRNDAMDSLIGTNACEDLSTSIFGRAAGQGAAGNCGPEIVRALASTPLESGLPDSTVATYTVGFALSDDDPGKKYLERLAVDGKGAYYNAENPAALNKALQDIVEDVSFGAESFVELSVGADRATFSNADRAYMNLFSPTDKAGWSGNLKGYMRGPDGLVDVNGNKATRNDGDVTRFAPGAQSFWSAEPDGNNIDRGGASSRLVAATRALYTAGPGDEGVALKDSAEHALDSANAALTPAMLGTDSRAERDAALAWLPAAAMGDPLHSKSVSIDYGDREVVYVMTNQGLLHAIDATETDATGGDELFAFMPKRLLRNLPVLQGGATGIDHVYGLDGGLTPWHTDTDGDGTVDDGEELLLVFGMRRGGTAYYALDVTDPASPRLDWVIDDATAGFEELAQSWSRPALVDVRSGGAGSTLKERVLVFAGGYDADRLDGRKKRREADGNAIYLVDRRGNRVARFAHPQMKHSIAADPTVIDSDADGLADRLYAADVGGQVWRVDFDDPTIDADTTVTRLADLGADHPFFAAPSVALNLGGGSPFLSIAVGSGDRTDPLEDDTSNAFFMLRDEAVDKGAPSAALPRIRVSDLYDATSDALSSSDAAVRTQAEARLIDARGWKIDLLPGEKSLSRVVAFEGKLLATTYRADQGLVDDPCEFGEDRRLYVMDIVTARSRPLSSENTTVTARYRSLDGAGIPSAPLATLNSLTGDADIYVGNEKVGEDDTVLRRVYWHAK